MIRRYDVIHITDDVIHTLRKDTNALTVAVASYWAAHPTMSLPRIAGVFHISTEFAERIVDEARHGSVTVEAHRANTYRENGQDDGNHD